MARAFSKDTLRTIANSKKRFISILVICALGVTMVCGLRASCVDLRNSADAFFNEQGLYDACVQSTLGLTSEDVDAVSALDGVAAAEGTWEENTYTPLGQKRASVGVKALSASGFNMPKVLSGTLPANAHEIAVSENYLTDSGLSLGSTVTLEPSENEVFERTQYTITASVIDPTELTNPNGSIAVRASASPDYSFFVTPDAVSADAFTALYVRAENPDGAKSFSPEYAALLDEVTSQLEGIKQEREEARTQSIRQDALDQIAEAEEEANSQLDEAQKKIESAQGTLDSGKQELAANKRSLRTSEGTLAQSEAQLREQEQQLKSASEQIDEGYRTLSDAQKKINAGRNQVNTSCDDAAAQVNAALAAGLVSEEEAAAQLAGIEAQRTQSLAQLDAQAKQLSASKQELDAQAAQVAAGKKAIAQGWSQLSAGKQQLESGKQQLSAAEKKLAQRQAELDGKRTQFEESKAEAHAKFEDARAEANDIEQARWYVQTRESNAGYASVESDASSIEAIGLVFPVVFIVVAVLIALTTIARLVEEERGLIGTYKSLGYGNRTILGKYLVYALSACLIGSAAGEFCGFVLFPTFLFSVFQMMYLLPTYLLSFDALYGVGSMLFFIAGIVGAAVFACRAELAQTPAMLMRPKAPRSGSRILLERIPFIWKRLAFLDKVTARNLLRYKKRFFMTVFGIMGCMALLICGFAIKDSVHALSPLQYGDIYRYDALAITSTGNFDACEELLENSGEVSSLQEVAVDSVTLTANGDDEALQLFVLPDEADLSPYVSLKSGSKPLALGDSGMILTRNAADLLGVGAGDAATVKTSSLDEAPVPINAIADNYLGNAVYVTQSAYQQLFGEDVEPNGFYLALSGSDSEKEAFAEDLAQRSEFLSVSSTQQMNEEFSQSFELINTIVYVIVFLAAALAFVVLFTLSTTNISERTRELATIKVLGFRKREVNHYVNKETMLLTVIGMVLGIPAGYAFSHMLTYVLKMPSIYFAVTIEPLSYVYACALTLLFAFIVAQLSNRTLAKINMIEALKSIE